MSWVNQDAHAEPPVWELPIDLPHIIAFFDAFVLPAATTAEAKPATVVIDIDDTAILPKQKAGDASIPNATVQMLYQRLLAKGIGVHFMTARLEYFAEPYTIPELELTGYSEYHGLIHMPWTRKEAIDLLISDSKRTAEHPHDAEHMNAMDKELTGLWKEEARSALAQEFSILATIDDSLPNLMGPSTGRKIHVKW